MYKGNLFKDGVLRKHSPTSEGKEDITYKDNYRYSAYCRVMEFLRSSALMVRYQDLDLNRF